MTDKTLTYKLEQFAYYDTYYLNRKWRDDGETAPDLGSGFPWKDGRPSVVIENAWLDPDYEGGVDNSGDPLAFVTTTPTGSILQFETGQSVGLIHANSVYNSGHWNMVFGKEDTLIANGACAVMDLKTLLQKHLEDEAIMEKQRAINKALEDATQQKMATAKRLGAENYREKNDGPLPTAIMRLLTQDLPEGHNQALHQRMDVIRAWLQGWDEAADQKVTY